MSGRPTAVSPTGVSAKVPPPSGMGGANAGSKPIVGYMVGSTPYGAGMNKNQKGKDSKRLPTYAGVKGHRDCPNCGDNAIIVFDNSSGDELCSRCGLVLEGHVMSDEQEWRSFSNDSGEAQDKSRVGGPNDTWLEDSVQGTAMLGGTQHKALMRTHEIATAVAGGDKLLKSAFANLRIVAESFSLRENVIERCKEIIKDLQLSGNLKNRTGILYVLAVVYLACREQGITRTLKELVTYDKSVREKDLGKAILRLKKMLPNRDQPLSFTAAELMPRFCSRLQLSQQVVNVAEHVCRNAEKVINRSHRPNSFAAGAIYLVSQLCNVSVNVEEIASTAGTGETTVKVVYKEMLPHVQLLLPPDFKPTLVGGIEALKRN